MAKIKICAKDLSGTALDWAVATIVQRMTTRVGLIVVLKDGKWVDHHLHLYSTDPKLSTPLIFARKIALFAHRDTWCAVDSDSDRNLGSYDPVFGYVDVNSGDTDYVIDGSTALIAGCRMLVCMELGPIVDVPEELV